jgi:Holliday junction resolvasome RuvABC endonuclease subunit
MIQRMLGLTEPAQEDAADALAVAITHTNATGLAALLKRA